MNKRLLRKIHRWLGLIAGLQLLAWTISGLYFTWFPIDEIHGDHLLTIAEPETALLREAQLLSPSEITGMHEDLADARISDISLTETLGTPVYLVGAIRVNALTGEKMSPLTEREAIAIVRSRTRHEISTAELVEQVAVDSEYRGGELPAWRLTLEEEAAAIYVGRQSGRIRAVRTDAWRWFDFLWSLHIMDYEEREDFNHTLIQVLAILGLATVLSGLILFFATQRWRKPARRTAGH